MNNPIFIFSVNLKIKCWFDYYTFHKSTSEFCFFFFFSKSQVLASSEVQTQINFYMYAILLPVISATDLTSQKTGWSNWGQCMRWLVYFDPRPLSVSLHLRVSILAVILIKGNESKWDWTQQTRIKIDFVHKPNQH